jgi:hypothetical protein
LPIGSGGSDTLVLSLDGSGTVSWQRTYGGSDDDRARSVRQTSDSGYVVAGDTTSFGAGGSDLSVLYLDNEGGIQGCDIVGSSSVSVSDTSISGYDQSVTISEVDTISSATRWNPDNSSAEVLTVCLLKKDTDGDGIPDGMPGETPCGEEITDNCADNCPDVANPDQADADGDGTGDACESSSLCPAEKMFGEYSAATENLRDFRDVVLSQSGGGRAIIKSYYRWSPGIVKVMEGLDTFKNAFNSFVH